MTKKISFFIATTSISSYALGSSSPELKSMVEALTVLAYLGITLLLALIYLVIAIKRLLTSTKPEQKSNKLLICGSVLMIINLVYYINSLPSSISGESLNNHDNEMQLLWVILSVLGAPLLLLQIKNKFQNKSFNLLSIAVMIGFFSIWGHSSWRHHLVLKDEATNGNYRAKKMKAYKGLSKEESYFTHHSLGKINSNTSLEDIPVLYPGAKLLHVTSRDVKIDLSKFKLYEVKFIKADFNFLLVWNIEKEKIRSIVLNRYSTKWVHKNGLSLNISVDSLKQINQSDFKISPFEMSNQSKAMVYDWNHGQLKGIKISLGKIVPIKPEINKELISNELTSSSLVFNKAMVKVRVIEIFLDQ